MNIPEQPTPATHRRYPEPAVVRWPLSGAVHPTNLALELPADPAEILPTKEEKIEGAAATSRPSNGLVPTKDIIGWNRQTVATGVSGR